MSNNKAYMDVIPFDMANSLVLAVRKHDMNADDLEVLYGWPANLIEGFFKDCLGTSIVGVQNAEHWSLLLHRPVGKWLIKTKPNFDDLAIILEQLAAGNTFPEWVSVEMSDDGLLLNGEPIQIDAYVTMEVGQQFMYVNIHHFYAGEDNRWRELVLANMVEINSARYEEIAGNDERDAWIDSIEVSEDSFAKTALNLI